MTFGERLANLRENKKLTQIELANLTSISRSRLSLYETNKREPDLQTVTYLADFFGVSTDYLLGNDQKKTANEKNETEQLTTEIQEKPEYIELHRLVKNMPKEEVKQVLSFAKYINNNLKGKDRRPDDDDDF